MQINNDENHRDSTVEITGTTNIHCTKEQDLNSCTRQEIEGKKQCIIRGPRKNELFQAYKRFLTLKTCFSAKRKSVRKSKNCYQFSNISAKSNKDIVLFD